MKIMSGRLLLLTYFAVLFFSTSGFAQGQLNNISVAPSNPKAGESTVYTISFQTSPTGNGTDSGIPADG